MAGTSLVHIKLPTTTPADDEAINKGYVDSEIVRTATEAGAGLALNADGKTFDVVAADATLAVTADALAVGVIQSANLAYGAVGNEALSATIGGLNNVNISADTPAAADEVLIWDGTEWVAGELEAGATAGAGLAFNATTTTDLDVVAADGTIVVTPDAIAVGVIQTANIADGAVTNLQSAVTLGGLNNVDITADTPTAVGDLLSWDGTEWKASAAAAGAVAGAGIADTAGTFDVVAADATIVVGTDDIAVGVIESANLAYGAVGNEALSATLGGLNNVDISVDTGRVAGDQLTWDGTALEWVATAAPVPVDLSNLVTLDTAQTLTAAAIKTFGGSPIVPSPLVDGEAANKLYVDTAVSLVSGQNAAVGVYDATTNLVTNVFAGAPSEVVVGALPAAAATNTGSYFIVNLSGAPAAPYANAGVGDWIISDGATAWTLIPLSGGYVTSADSPGVGDVTGSYSTGFQIGDGALVATDFSYGAVNNDALGAQLGALTDVTLAGVSDPAPTIAGVGLVWDGTAWAASVDSVVVGTLALDDLSDVTAPTPLAGDHLVYDGTAAAWVPTAAGVAVAKFAGDVGDGVLTTIPVVHNLNTTDVTVQAWEGVNAVNVGVAATDANTVTLTFAVAPLAAAVRVVVIG